MAGNNRGQKKGGPGEAFSSGVPKSGGKVLEVQELRNHKPELVSKLLRSKLYIFRNTTSLSRNKNETVKYTKHVIRSRRKTEDVNLTMIFEVVCLLFKVQHQVQSGLFQNGNLFSNPV